MESNEQINKQNRNKLEGTETKRLTAIKGEGEKELRGKNKGR